MPCPIMRKSDLTRSAAFAVVVLFLPPYLYTMLLFLLLLRASHNTLFGRFAIRLSSRNQC